MKKGRNVVMLGEIVNKLDILIVHDSRLLGKRDACSINNRQIIAERAEKLNETGTVKKA
jgi:hypothetical protein